VSGLAEPVVWQDGFPTLDAQAFTLPCGLEVIVHEDHAVPLCAVWMGYRVGSSDEGDGTSGFAHLFEHMFKNSVHLAGRHHYEVLREAGATDANAQTGTDRTLYHETMPRAALDTALWIEADRMGYFLPALDDERLAKQIQVVQAERRQRYENAPYGPERFAVAEALYPDGHPLRYLTIGRHEDIAAATRAKVESFYRTWYVPANATLVLAGDVTRAEAEEGCAKWFGSFPASARPVRREWPTPAVAGPVELELVDPLAALVRVRRAWHGPAAHTDDDVALDILVLALATPGTGKLWRALVYDRSLAQRVSAHVQSGRLGGELHLTVDLRAGVEVAEVTAVIDAVMSGVIDGDALEEREVVRSVRRREAGLLWRLDGLGRRASLLVGSQLSSEQPQVTDELRRYLTTDAARVRAAARRWLGAAGMVQVITRAGRA
jgi:predicted Zn-dependent peptidase